MKTMQQYKTIIIGGGASGLFLANLLCKNGENPQAILLIERGERLGRKLSATGNGQGNITNLSVTKEGYFSTRKQDIERIEKIIQKYDDKALGEFFARLGVLLLPDERGRVYPASRQASALTDALRFGAEKVQCLLGAKATKITKGDNGLQVTIERAETQERYFAENIVLCAGGKAAKNFGTDGGAYALAQAFGHTVTSLYPSLVQLKTEVTHTKTLKGIRVNDGKVTARFGGESVSLRGDVIFTDYGVSGDAIFRISAYIADKIEQKVTLSVDFLPEISQEDIRAALYQKRAAYPDLPTNELLFGIVNNQIGRAIFRRANGDIDKAAALVKDFSLPVTGSLGYDYAQVTKGGIPLVETDENLQSKQVSNLYFAGEILDVDGACGGFNLQWAFSSACMVAEGILAKNRSK